MTLYENVIHRVKKLSSFISKHWCLVTEKMGAHIVIYCQRVQHKWKYGPIFNIVQPPRQIVGQGSSNMTTHIFTNILQFKKHRLRKIFSLQTRINNQDICSISTEAGWQQTIRIMSYKGMFISLKLTFLSQEL